MALHSIQSQLTSLSPLPGYVVSIGEPRIPPAVCFKGDIKATQRHKSAYGPWDIDVQINGPAGGYYARPEGYRVRLECTTDYPKKCPTITFMSIIHHLHLDKNHRPDVKFIDGLKKDFTISHILEVSSLVNTDALRA
eukprot:1184954-Prorocentrum_minimum.AAC.5